MLLKAGARVPKNKYDSLVFYNKTLFTLELKSTKSKNISFSESIIKQHQIDNLEKASKFPNVIAGFLFNFRENNNETYFVDINDFLRYKNIAQNGLEHTYKSRVNKSSIPIDICREIGEQLTWEQPKTRYKYHIDRLFNELIHRNNKTT